MFMIPTFHAEQADPVYASCSVYGRNVEIIRSGSLAANVNKHDALTHSGVNQTR